MLEYDTAVLQHLPYGRGWPEAPELPTVSPVTACTVLRWLTASVIGVSRLLMIQHSALNGTEDKKKCVCAYVCVCVLTVYWPTHFLHVGIQNLPFKQDTTLELNWTSKCLYHTANAAKILSMLSGWFPISCSESNDTGKKHHILTFEELETVAFKFSKWLDWFFSQSTNQLNIIHIMIWIISHLTFFNRMRLFVFVQQKTSLHWPQKRLIWIVIFIFYFFLELFIVL